jgi:16S rRNA processing protein RimM
MLSKLAQVELPVDAIEVGRITDAWGLKGWFKILPYSAQPEALLASKQWFLLPSDRGVKAFSGCLQLSVLESKEHSENLVACVQGVQERDAAEALRGARIFIARSNFPSPSIDEFYWVDLIGLMVVNRQNEALGTVRELLSTGPQTVLVLEQHEGDKRVERMIPFVSVYVDTVDLAAKVIHVDWQADF